MKSKIESINTQTNQKEGQKMTLQEKMNQLQTQSQTAFEHDPIVKSIIGHSQNVNVEYFKEINGEIIKGFSVYDSNEYIKEAFGSNFENRRQIFITKEGRFLCFNTTKETYFCQKCNEDHYRLSRKISEKQYFSLRELFVVYNSLSQNLNQKPLFNDPPMLNE